MEVALKYKSIIIIALFIIAMTNSYILFAQCPQNNFTVTGFQLRNQSGQIFSVTDNYTLGQPITGQLWVNFGGSTTNGYNMLMFYDVFKNGVKTSDDQYDCLFSGTQVVQNTWVKVRDFTWNWGDVIEIKDIFMYWETGTAQPGTTCIVKTKNNINSQCYGNPSGFTAAVPLYPKFDFGSNGICNTTIQFTSQTIGGTPPFNYSYSWDFNNDGIFDSNLANPVYNFPSTGTYPITLRVNDGTSITTIVKDIFIDPNFGIQVDIFPTKINDSSGIIYVKSVTGGTPPYTYSWTGPNGFTSTSKDIFNLSDGLYTLTVTDSNGCTQTVTYEMDIASVLGFSWKSLDLKSNQSAIDICWEVATPNEDCTYEIQRSSRDISNFVEIGKIAGNKSNGGFQAYVFSDTSFPFFEDTYYYRVVRKSHEKLDFSPVKMIQLENRNTKDKGWAVYPNPSLGSDIFIKYLGKIDSSEKVLTIDIFNSGLFHQTVTFQAGLDEPIKIKELFKDLPKGHLIMRILLGNETEVIQLVY